MNSNVHYGKMLTVMLSIIVMMYLLVEPTNAQSEDPPVWPQMTHTVGQWRCMHPGLACTNVGSWGQFHSYLLYDDDGNFLRYREDVVANSTTDILPYIRELIDAPNKTIWEYFFDNSASSQLNCFTRHGSFIWPSDWVTGAEYMGVQTFHGRSVWAYNQRWILLSIPNNNTFYVDIETNTFIGMYQPLGGLEYWWFTYEPLATFPSTTWFDPPTPAPPCSKGFDLSPLPWR